MTDQNLISSTNNSYSQALYELAYEENSLNDVEKNAQSILKLIHENLEFLSLISDPTISQDEQTKAVETICKKFELNENFEKFLKLLIIKRKLFFVKKY